MSWLQNVIVYLKIYGEGCTIAGLSYIANRRLHFIERFFWLVCVLISTYGAYYLINEYRVNFQKKSVSIVYESLVPYTKFKFPAIAVCNFCKGLVSPRIEEYINSICTENCHNYDYNKETQLLLFVCPEKYRDGAMRSECQKVENSGKYSECIQQESRDFVEKFSFNCTETFIECSSSGETFDCCHYFRPLVTPFGMCFIMNSLQNNRPQSRHWFNKEFVAGIDVANVTVMTRTTLHVTVLNPEDIPNIILPGISTKIIREGKQKIFQVFLENMINDPDVREVSPKYRKCRFPDETEPTSLYRAHSFSACLNDCIRMHQKRLCNCSIQSLVPKANPKFPPCNLRGLYCLERFSMIRPDAKSLLPWSPSGIRCDCLPSCTEQTITAVYDSMQFRAPMKKSFVATITIPTHATQSYRRQVLRTPLDTVVTIGGILGLFLGASVLSGVELLYYFLRWLSSYIVIRK